MLNEIDDRQEIDMKKSVSLKEERMQSRLLKMFDENSQNTENLKWSDDEINQNKIEDDE